MFKSSKFIGNFWVGISDRATEGTWISEKTNKSIIYERWKEGQPNNEKGIEDCGTVAMLNKNIGLWNNRDCSIKLNYVCKKEGEVTLDTKGMKS